MANASRIQAKNCFIDVLDSRQRESVILNIYYHAKTAGEYEQIILPRRMALALALILQEEGELE